MSAVDVVITHYRSPEDLARCLDSLQETGVSQVVVADSEVHLGTSAVVRTHGRDAEYVGFADNVGYARLVNAGLEHTSSDYILVLNADVQVTADAVAEMAAYLDANPDVGIVGPAMRYRSGEPQNTAFAFYRPFTILCRRTPVGRTRLGRAELDRFTLGGHAERAIRRGTPLDADWLMGAALLVRREAVRDIGLVEESYFLYFEDVDWCLRAWRRGWRVVYLPSATVVHGWSRASKKGGVAAILSNRLARRHIASALRFFRMHGLRAQRPIRADVGLLRVRGV